MTSDGVIMTMFVLAGVSLFLSGATISLCMILIMIINRKMRKRAKWFGMRRGEFEKILRMERL